MWEEYRGRYPVWEEYRGRYPVWEESRVGGKPCGRDPVWEESCVGGIPCGRNTVGAIPLGAIPWEESRGEENHDHQSIGLVAIIDFITYF